LRDRRGLAADRARWVALDRDLVERRAERVEQEQPPLKRLADAEQQLQCFVRLQRTDDPGENAEHTAFGAARSELRGRRRGEEAAVARPVAGVEDGDLALEA